MRIFTVARDFADEADDGTVRLLVNTDIPYSDEEADRLADIIDAIGTGDLRLVLNNGEVQNLRSLLDDCKLIWPDPIKQVQGWSVQHIIDRLDAAIADKEAVA